MTNGRDFAVRLDRAAQLLEEDAGKLQRRMALLAFQSLVRRTPVDTGRARAGWQIGIGTPPQGEGRGGEGAALNVLLSIRKPNRTVWINNNVPYIEYLEGGSSKQAPDGMVTPTVVELRRQLRAEWSRIRRQ